MYVNDDGIIENMAQCAAFAYKWIDFQISRSEKVIPTEKLRRQGRQFAHLSAC